MAVDIDVKGDFENEILPDLGQAIDILLVTRTINANGEQTATSTATTATTGVVIEVAPIHQDWLNSGLLKVGDIVVYVRQSEDVSATRDELQFTVVRWNSTDYRVNNIEKPVRIGGSTFGWMRLLCNRTNDLTG